MSGTIERGRIVGAGGSGAVFQGVGDRDMETHFTYDAEDGFHVSTYLNLGLGDGNEKTKVDQDEFGNG